MVVTTEPLPDDVDALKTALRLATTRALQVQAELASARAQASDDQAVRRQSGWLRAAIRMVIAGGDRRLA